MVITCSNGAKSRAMGGVGIAKSFGATSGLANPALVSSVKNMEFQAAATVFMPNVTFETNAMSNAQQLGSTPAVSEDSAANMSVIPEMAFAQRVSDNFTYGLSATGTAGMGVDYSNPALAKMNTALQLMKVALPLSFNKGGLSLGVAPILQYGTLSIEYATPQGASDNGTSSDTGYGYQIGAAYTTSGLTIGLNYTSQISMTYKDQISAATKAFGLRADQTTGVAAGLSDTLTQPAEFGIGVSYVMGESTIAADYKNIAWGNAEGYKDFNWKDQRVFAVGYEYAPKGWALRVGYNHADNPIQELPSSNMMAGQYDGAAINLFNMGGFPAIVEDHYTLGAGFDVLENLSVDAAVIYAPETSQSINTTAMTQGMIYQGAMQQQGTAIQNGQLTQQQAQQNAGAAAAGAAPSYAKVTHSQTGVTLAMTYKF